MSEFEELYCKILTEMGLSNYTSGNFSSEFETLTTLLLNANAQMNLTALKTEEDIIKKHYGDCLYIASHIKEGASLLDVGCGGGFPSLPLGIVRRDLCITSLDSTAKKLNFVKDTAEKLHLNLQILNGRAEELAHDSHHREEYDAVTARAVAPLPILAEWCLPFVKKGGIFLAMKGPSGREELEQAKNALEILGGTVKTVEEIHYDEGTRVNLFIEKVKNTPDRYPRENRLISKKPL